MPVKVLKFFELKKTIDDTGDEPLDILAKKAGKVYVVAVTREKCPGCEKQKPLFEKLSHKIGAKCAGQTEFFRVHSAFTSEQKEEAKKCLTSFRTVAFPTYILAIKDSDGCVQETYRAIEPPMSEIERNIKTATQIASWFKQPKK
jgi:thiol-disulfide isomerase/thioredoxin